MCCCFVEDHRLRGFANASDFHTPREKGTPRRTETKYFCVFLRGQGMFKFLAVRAFPGLAAAPAAVAAIAYVTSNVAEAEQRLPPGASDAPTTVKYSFVSYNANNPCEDTFSIVAKTDRSVPFKTACAVFDGHGGRQVAKYAESNFLKYFQNNLSTEPHETLDQDRIKLSIMNTFSHIDTELRTLLKPVFDLGFGSVARVGACACMAVLHLDNSLTVANAGDCRAVLGSLSSNDGLNVIATPRQSIKHKDKRDTNFNSINVMNGDGGEFQENCLASSKIVAKPLTSVHNACEEAEKRKLAKVSFTQ